MSHLNEISQAATMIKESMSALGSLHERDVKFIYQNLSEYDEKVLREAATIISVELLGGSAFKLTTRSSSSVYTQALDQLRVEVQGSLSSQSSHPDSFSARLEQSAPNCIETKASRGYFQHKAPVLLSSLKDQETKVDKQHSSELRMEEGLGDKEISWI